MTKRQYAAKMTDLTSQRDAIQTEIDTVISNEIVSEYEALNAKYDAVTDLNTAMKDLERAWDRRKWTSVDRQQWNMIANNID